MRKKPERTESFGVADGFDFSNESDEQVNAEKKVESMSTSGVSKIRPVVSTNTEIDPNRCYSPYYTPKPKKGSKGGSLGRGPVDASERKVQFSLTCTPAQKKRFMEAAQNDKRKLPEFICTAVEEYIENHNL